MHVEREGEVEVSNRKLAHREVEDYIYILFSRESIQKPSPENRDEGKFCGAENTWSIARMPDGKHPGQVTRSGALTLLKCAMVLPRLGLIRLSPSLVGGVARSGEYPVSIPLLLSIRV